MAKGRQREKKHVATSSISSSAVPKSSSARMQKAWELFDGGDKVMARREVKQILASDPSADEVRESEDLLERLKTPRVAFIFALAAATIMVMLIVLAILRY